MRRVLGITTALLVGLAGYGLVMYGIAGSRGMALLWIAPGCLLAATGGTAAIVIYRDRL